MRKLSQFLSGFLTLAFLSTMLPTKVLAVGVSVETDQVKAASEQKKTEKKESRLIGEIKEKREKNVKHFLLDNNVYEAVVYNEPVHFYQDGQWKDVDNSLEENTDTTFVSNETILTTSKQEDKNILKNKQNDYSVKFAKNSNGNKLVSVEKDGYGLSWNIEGAAKAVYNVVKPDMEKISAEIAVQASEEVDRNLSYSGFTAEEKTATKSTIIENEKKKLVLNATSTIEYKEILPQVDVRYHASSGSLKEDVVISSYKENLQIVFNLNTKNLSAKLESNRIITFYDASNPSKVIFSMAAPYMYDQTGVQSEAVQVKLEESKNGYILTIIPDDKWMKDTSRVYPIVIDPPIETPTGIKDIQDTFAASTDSTIKYQNQYNRVGNTAGVGITRTYIKFTLPTLTKSSVVTKYFALKTLHCAEQNIESSTIFARAECNKFFAKYINQK